MCLDKTCVYIEILELSCGEKLYIHYKRDANNKLVVLWIDY